MYCGESSYNEFVSHPIQFIPESPWPKRRSCSRTNFHSHLPSCKIFLVNPSTPKPPPWYFDEPFSN